MTTNSDATPESKGAPGDATERWDVFISYATEDAALAKEIRAELRAKKLRAFVAQEDMASVVGNKDWTRALDDVLDLSSTLIVLLSQASMTSAAVESEWRAFHRFILERQPRTLIPVRLAGMEGRKLPASLAGYQLVEWTQAASMARLLALVPGVHGTPAPNAAPVTTAEPVTMPAKPERSHRVLGLVRPNKEQLRRLVIGVILAVVAVGAVLVGNAYRNNRALETSTHASMDHVERLLKTSATPSDEIPKALDRLHAAFSQLSLWEREGAPTSFRFGMYVGNRLLPEVRDAYRRALDGFLRKPLLAYSEQRLHFGDGPGIDEREQALDCFRTYLSLTGSRDVPRADAHAALQNVFNVALKGWKSVSLSPVHWDALLDELEPRAKDPVLVENASKGLVVWRDVTREYADMVKVSAPELRLTDAFRDQPWLLRTSAVSAIPGRFTTEGSKAVAKRLQTLGRGLAAAKALMHRDSEDPETKAKLLQLAAMYSDDFRAHWITALSSLQLVSPTDSASARKILLAHSSSPRPYQRLWKNIVDQAAPVPALSAGETADFDALRRFGGAPTDGPNGRYLDEYFDRVLSPLVLELDEPGASFNQSTERARKKLAELIERSAPTPTVRRILEALLRAPLEVSPAITR